MTDNHTQGPWAVISSVYKDFMDITGPSFLIRVCMLADDITKSDRQKRIADMHLIAAVPDLLEALEAFLAGYLDFAGSGDGGFWDPEKEDFVIMARKALAKARGES